MKSKILAIVCVLALVFSLGVAAFAASGDMGGRPAAKTSGEATDKASAEASGEASGESSGEAKKTRGDLGEIKKPEDAAETILGAFSCKSFTDEPVTDEELAEILAAGINAPSAINTQPWQFIVVQDEALKDSLVKGAPALVIVAVPEEDYTMGGDSQFAAGCAAESMYLYAQAIGLGAHMYTAPVAMTISADPAAYGVAEGYEAAVVLAFGHYDDYVDAASGASVRNEYDSFVTVLK